ncbi:LysR family transcriptional regulator [Spirillospora sp. NPDC047418]
MQLELRHLRALCAIADAGSLSRAATVVGVSQPALTAQLQRIEAALGGQVFRRDRLGVSPTPFGLFVLSRARSALVTVDELLLGTAAEPDTAQVRIGGYANTVLNGLLRELFEIPGMRVTVHTEYSPRLLLDLLASRRLDLATLIDYPGNELPAVPSVSTMVITTEPIFIALPETHPLAAAKEVALADLADADWLVSPPDGSGWPEVFYSTCQEEGFTPRVLHTTSDREMIRTLVRKSGAVVPCQATLREDPDLAVRPLAGSPLIMRHLLAWRDGGPLADRAAELAAAARTVYLEAATDNPTYQAWLSCTENTIG